MKIGVDIYIINICEFNGTTPKNGSTANSRNIVYIK
jgi:hypothetical protein